MKKVLFFVVMGLVSLSAQLSAIEPIRINESISLEVLDNEYVIDFKSPYCEERVVKINRISNSEIFSKIVFGESAESISLVYDKQDESVKDICDIFDYMEGKGIPNTPFLTLNLQIPQDSKYDVQIKDIEYWDLNSGKVSTTPIPYHLKYPYVPCQDFFADEELKEIQINREEYSKKQFNKLFTISEPYGAMGTSGITFNISPFIYLPTEQTVVLIHSAKFIVHINAPISLPDMMDKELNNEKAMATSGAYIYDNYLGTIKKHSSTIDKGRYLIITTSDKYAEALTPYITHKRKIGYDVTLHVQNGGYPHDPVALRKYIKSMYDNIGSRPQFVLLVGDYSQIPVSYGTLESQSDPPTDIYYACLEKSDIGSETNFYPEVYIGRWPVSSAEEITKIANKVINFEQTTNYSRRFELYSGTGNYSSTFESDNNKAAKKLKDIHLADVQSFKGSDGIDGTFMCKEFVNYNVLMTIYNGHGSKYSLGSPYDGINSSAISSMVNTPYYMVTFACLLNHPQMTSFGPSWIRDGYRTLAYYGSTVITTTSSDTYFSKHIFDYFTSQTDNIRYAQIMEHSAGKYYNALKNSTRKKETKKYLFLGDPTVFSLGMTGHNGNPKTYSKAHNDIDQNDFILNETEQIKSVSIYNTLGQLLLQREGSNISSTSDLQSVLLSIGKGVYIVSIRTTENDYIKKINL